MCSIKTMCEEGESRPKGSRLVYGTPSLFIPLNEGVEDLAHWLFCRNKNHPRIRGGYIHHTERWGLTAYYTEISHIIRGSFVYHHANMT